METSSAAVAVTDGGQGGTPGETSRDSLYISLNEVNRKWHKAKSTIGRDIKTGKLQWHDRAGTKLLYAPEVANLYGALPTSDGDQSQTGTSPVQVTDGGQSGTTDKANENRLLEVVTASKDEVIKALEARIADLQGSINAERENAAKWEEQATRWHTAYDSVKALPAPVTTVATSPEAAPIRAAEPPRRGFLGLFKRAG